MANQSQDEAMSTSISEVPGAGLPTDDAAPENAVSAAPKKKEPPPESAESFRIRSLVIFSFWAIVLFLGLPVWWRTTAIYRARLPLSQMMDWADGRVDNHLPLDNAC
jgi:phosphatidylinositol glycan class S